MLNASIQHFAGKSGVNPALSRNCIKESCHCSPLTKVWRDDDLESGY